MKRELLSKLMSLSSGRADAYLLSFADEIISKTISSHNNDEIFQNLELLETFVYKAPKQVVEIFKYILKTAYKQKSTKSKFGILEGKSREDLILKGLDLLGRIRYILPNPVLRLLEEVIEIEKGPAKEKALEILKSFAKYDYHVLFKSKIGYRAQRTALDYILRWSFKKQIANWDFVLVVVKELLSTSVEGSEWVDEKTLTMHSTHVDPTDFLKKLRKETMDLVYNLYRHTSEPKMRLELVTALEEAMRRPGSAVYSDELGKMLEDDAKYLADIYRGMIFDGQGNLIPENIAVSEEVDERLYYYSIPGKFRASEYVKLRNDIHKDPFYGKVFPIIGGRASYRGEEGITKADQRRKEDQERLVAEISDDSFEDWKGILEVLASQKGIIEEWKLGSLRSFLMLLSSEKPDISDKILDSAYKRDGALVRFSESFLMGFRDADRLDLWDTYVEHIFKKKDAYLVGGICWSLGVYRDNQPTNELRKGELEILEEIVYKKGRFAFLAKKRKDDGTWHLHERLLHALAFNFCSQPRKMERLLKAEISNNPDFSQVYYQGLQFVTDVENRLDLSLASNPFKRFLLDKVVEAPDLDWHLQEFLIALCKGDFTCVMETFRRRILRSGTLKETEKAKGKGRLVRQEKYEAIPYHFNPDLQEILQENKDLPKAIMKWVSKMTPGWSPYNWEVGRFLEGAGVDMSQIFSRTVKRSDDKTLLRIASTLDGNDGSNLDLCMEIIGRTDDVKIKRKIESIIFSTGVVSGEYGFADAYKKKTELLQPYKKSKNRRKKSFATEMIGRLGKEEIEERKRVDEDMQLRKIQFEG
ncbi:MAG: hypothetical protein HGA31_04795 [Candidatus Moranbacteria bacterium]|nr:hypothetical protein [Candidatus Moranbacteria bacterium]